jgi:hypothetical protein
VERKRSVLPGNFLRRTKLGDGAMFRVYCRFAGLRDGRLPEMILDFLPYAT